MTSEDYNIQLNGLLTISVLLRQTFLKIDNIIINTILKQPN